MSKRGTGEVERWGGGVDPFQLPIHSIHLIQSINHIQSILLINSIQSILLLIVIDPFLVYVSRSAGNDFNDLCQWIIRPLSSERSAPNRLPVWRLSLTSFFSLVFCVFLTINLLILIFFYWLLYFACL